MKASEICAKMDRGRPITGAEIDWILDRVRVAGRRGGRRLLYFILDDEVESFEWRCHDWSSMELLGLAKHIEMEQYALMGAAPGADGECTCTGDRLPAGGTRTVLEGCSGCAYAPFCDSMRANKDYLFRCPLVKPGSKELEENGKCSTSS